MDPTFGKSPTFVVPSDKQRGTLDALVRREQRFSERLQKNKPLCFSARAYQRTHPKKAANENHKDADATLVSPMLVGVADGVSQIADFGLDPSELPQELLGAVEELAVEQLLPEMGAHSADSGYVGPIPLVRQAYENTESLGSTTLLLGIMDNSTKIHGRLHPMIAVISVGDCQIIILRRIAGELQAVFNTEMQRIDGHAQAPLQLARVDESIDPNFTEDLAFEVIDNGSAVHCVSAYEGDIVVLGSDGVFDNLFVEDIVRVCEEMLPVPTSSKFEGPMDRAILGRLAKRIVEEAHAKTYPGPTGWRDTPIGRGGKCDDTCCVVGEVVEWTEAHSDSWAALRRHRQLRNMLNCHGLFDACCCAEDSDAEEVAPPVRPTRNRNYPSNPDGSFSTYWGSFSEYGDSFARLRRSVSGLGGSFVSPKGSFSEYMGHSFTSVNEQSARSPRAHGKSLRVHDSAEEEEHDSWCSMS